MGRISPLLILVTLAIVSSTASATPRNWLCDWRLSPFSWFRRTVPAAQEIPQPQETPAPPTPATVTPPVPEQTPPFHIRLTALARQQAEDQNITESELAAILSAPPNVTSRGGRDLFATFLPLRGSGQTAIGLNLRRTVEYWQVPRHRQITVRKITAPFDLTMQARKDLARLHLNFLAFENLLTQLENPPRHSRDHWELEITRRRHLPLRVLYVTSNQKAHVYRVIEVQPDKPQQKSHRIQETPVEVHGVWMTESAKQQWESEPFEIERALDDMSDITASASGESFSFKFSDRSNRSFTIEFAEDDLYGIVIRKVSRAEKKTAQTTPQAPLQPTLPFAMFPITEKALAYWGMTLEDLVALFHNRKVVPAPIGVNDLGLDPTREIFVSTTSRAIKKAGFTRRFEVITSTTLNGIKPVVLSIKLAPAESKPATASQETPLPKPELPKGAPVPYPELNEVAVILLQSRELAQQRPALFGDLVALIKMSQEFYTNLELLRSNPDLRELVEEENSSLEQRMALHVKDMSAHTAETNRNEGMELLLEILPGDATPWTKSFASELRTAYELYAKSQNWQIESLPTSNGAAANTHLRIRGRNAWNFMRLEEGVQRQIIRSPDDRRGSHQSTHTARASITVVKGPLSSSEMRAAFERKRATQPLQFVRSYHLPSNRLTDERLDRVALEPAEVLRQGKLEPLHRQIEYQVLVSYLRDLIGN